MWSALSDEKIGFFLGSESHGTHDHILLFQFLDFSHLEGQIPVFISPRNRVALLHPQALGWLFLLKSGRS
jgi:hypothetical protein